MICKFSFKFIVILTVFTFFSCKKSSEDPPQNTTCTSTLAEFEKIQIFPSDNLLNVDISASPIDPNSASIISAIGSAGIHADFGSGLWNGAPIGIPYSVVCGNQAKVPITFRANSYDGNYGNESEPGPYPVPLNAAIEGNGNGDSHVLTVDIENKVLYEMYNASKAGSGWEASCGAVI